MIEGLIAGLLAVAASAFVIPFLEPSMTVGTMFTWPPWRGLRNHPYYWAGIIVTVAVVVVTNILIGGITDDEEVRAVRNVAGVRVGITVLNAVVGFFVMPWFVLLPRLLVERERWLAREVILFDEVRRLPTFEARIRRARVFLQVGLISQETYNRWLILVEDG